MLWYFFYEFYMKIYLNLLLINNSLVVDVKAIWFNNSTYETIAGFKTNSPIKTFDRFFSKILPWYFIIDFDGFMEMNPLVS